MRRGEDVRRLGHEVDAEEDDEVGLGMLGADAGELERVPGVVGEADDLLHLVVVAEDQEPLPELRAARGDALEHLLEGGWTGFDETRCHERVETPSKYHFAPRRGMIGVTTRWTRIAVDRMRLRDRVALRSLYEGRGRTF